VEGGLGSVPIGIGALIKRSISGRKPASGRLTRQKNRSFDADCPNMPGSPPPRGRLPGISMIRLNSLCPGVDSLEGELLVYFVQSRSRRNIKHRVDLAAFDGAGWCSCEDFEFRVGPLLKSGIPVLARKHCEHVQRARTAFAISMARTFLELKMIQDPSKQPM